LIQSLRANYGFWTDGTIGWTFGILSNMDKNFTIEDGLGPDLSLKSLGTSYGGHVHALLFRRLVLSPGGYTLRYTSSETGKGQALMRLNLMGGNIGYVVYNKNQFLIYPFVGYVGGLSNLKLTNYHIDSIRYGNVWVQRNEFEEFKAKSLSFLELGGSAKFMTKHQGGVMIGVELGGYFNLNKKDWEHQRTQNMVPDIVKAAFSGFYLRFTLGGGLFKMEPVSTEKEKKKPRYRRQRSIEDEIRKTAPPAAPELKN
jgi:hypothetical protein